MTLALVARTASGTVPKTSCRKDCASWTALVGCRLMLGGPKAGGKPSHELSAAIRAPTVAFWTPADAATHCMTVCEPRRPPAFFATQLRVSLDAAKVTFRMLLLMALMQRPVSLAV